MFMPPPRGGAGATALAMARDCRSCARGAAGALLLCLCDSMAREKGGAPEYEVLSLEMSRKEVPSASMMMMDEYMRPAVGGRGVGGS